MFPTLCIGELSLINKRGGKIHETVSTQIDYKDFLFYHEQLQLLIYGRQKSYLVS